MKGLSNLAGAALAAVTVTYIWWIASQRHPTPVAELRDLAASPLCLTPSGTPQPGSPSIAAAWQRTMGGSVNSASPLYHGTSSIELRHGSGPAQVTLSFVRSGEHRWRPAQDVATAAWAARLCRTR